MKRLLISAALLLGLVAPLLTTNQVAAVDILDPVCQQAIDNGSELPQVCKDNQAAATNNPITGTLKLVVDMLSLVAGIIAVIMIIIAGLRFVVSGDDSTSVASARRSLIFALIGIAIVALAQFIVPFLLNQLK